MQFKLLPTTVLLLLASYTSAQTIGEEIDNGIEDINNAGDNLTGGASSVLDDIKDSATSVLNDIKDSATSVFSDITGGATSVWDNIEDKASSVYDDFKDITLPTITQRPSDVENWWNGVETELGSLPTEAWSSIKDGVYPAEISQWVESLPENMRADASGRLDALAEDVGNRDSAASSNKILTISAAAAVGVFALAVML